MTRSDVGPAKVAIAEAPVGSRCLAAECLTVPAHVRHMLVWNGPRRYQITLDASCQLHCTQGPATEPKKTDDDALDETKFDEFMGSDNALLAGTTGEYDKDDKEADDIWAHVDSFMDDRRRVRQPF